MEGIDTQIKEAVITIKILGIGGGGSTVLKRLADKSHKSVELIAINTDEKQLEEVAQAGVKTLPIGTAKTKGRGTGGSVELAEEIAEGSEEALREVMQGADLVFVVAGMGGGFGSGAAPVVAHLAKEMNILTVGVVTVPFGFEGTRKKRVATEGIAKMQVNLDALLSIQNDNLMKLHENRRLSLKDAFAAVDDVLYQAIGCVTELILTTGVINVDFADVATIFRQSASADALLGIGRSEKDAVDAVRRAVESPLVEKSLDGARGIIFNLTGSSRLSIGDVNEATRYIYEHTNPDVNIILGTVIDESLGDQVRATIIATDFVDGIVLKTPRIKPPVVESAKPQGSLEPPSFMNSRVDSVPKFKMHTDFSVPKFRTDKKEE